MLLDSRVVAYVILTYKKSAESIEFRISGTKLRQSITSFYSKGVR